MLSRFEALRSGDDAAGRARRGNRAAAAPLGSRRRRRRAGGADLRRAGHRQVAARPRRCPSGSRTEPHTRLRYFCSPHHQDSALYPVIAQLERAAGFAPATTRRAKLGKLQALLAPAPRDGRRCRADGELLSLPQPISRRRSTSARSAKGEDCSRRCCGQLEGLARHQPVLMVFEDAPLDRPDLARAAGSD